MAQKLNKGRMIKFLLSSAGGILSGYLLNKYGKDKIKQFFVQTSDKVQQTQNKWYQDGQKQAQQLEEMKKRMAKDL